MALWCSIKHRVSSYHISIVHYSPLRCNEADPRMWMDNLNLTVVRCKDYDVTSSSRGCQPITKNKEVKKKLLKIYYVALCARPMTKKFHLTLPFHHGMWSNYLTTVSLFTTSCWDTMFSDDLIDVNVFTWLCHRWIHRTCLGYISILKTMPKKQQRELKGIQSNDNHQSSDYGA